MRLTVLNCLLLLMLGSLAAAPAVDVTGKWTAETLMGSGGGELLVPTTFTFKVEGNKLTGTVSSPNGKFEIQEGKSDGGTILFSIVVGSAKILYDGLITEKGIDFIARFEGRDRSNHFLARRVPS